jgi:hypothetical protein
LVTDLRAHRARQAEELLRFGKRLSDDDFVITRTDGSAVRPHSLGQEWVRFLARNRALRRIRFHDLVTLDLYSHVLPNMQADAAAIVDDALRAVLNKRGAKG